ncbi:MAG TPA: alpha/beta hydrolase [Xanthomonadales bacterium]|nr:alpha/beta hydrolase [Xanthomonadales bacterium]
MTIVISPEQWRKGADLYEFRGHNVFMRKSGDWGRDTRVLVLLHGFPTASWDWNILWDAVAARFRVLTADMLGFGYSAKPRNHEYSLLEQADLFEDMLIAYGVHAYDILAHDYGSSVAQELLARHEDRLREGMPGPVLRSVVFLNGGLFPEAHRARRLQTLLQGRFGWLVSMLMTKRSFSQGFSEIFGPETQPDEAEIDAFWELLRYNGGRFVFHRLIAYIGERMQQRDRWVEAMRTSAVPLRFVNGLADPVSGAHMVARYRELIPDADIVELDGIGHYPQIEAPAEVLEACHQFWEKVRI